MNTCSGLLVVAFGLLISADGAAPAFRALWATAADLLQEFGTSVKAAMRPRLWQPVTMGGDDE